MKHPKYEAMLRALTALYLEVDKSIADDISQKVTEAFTERPDLTEQRDYYMNRCKELEVELGLLKIHEQGIKGILRQADEYIAAEQQKALINKA